MKSEIFVNTEFKNENVMLILEKLYFSKNRVRLFYGRNGKVWNEEFDILGYIGRSTGNIKIPLLINNKRSIGGGGILQDNIIGVFDTQTNKKLYWNDNYNLPIPYIKDNEVYLDGELYGRCKTNKDAIKLGDFMSGKRFSK